MSPEPTSIPITAIHTVAAALSLVPESHWTAEAHKSNISSYDGSVAITSSSSSSSPLSSSEQDALHQSDEKTRVAADKRFKKELYHYLRWALSAGAPGPGIPETMRILGRAESVRRLEEGRRLTAELAEGGQGQTQGEQGQDKAWMGSLAPKQ